MRRLIPSLLPFALLVALLGGNAMAQQFSSLEERMSEAEFKAAGLDKLSAEELANLNTWLSGRVQPASQMAMPAEDRRGLRSGGSDGDDGSAIVSRITGEFRGWRKQGDRFVLENGQIWEITDFTSKFVVRLQDPTVRIEPGVFSAWYLRVEGYNATVKVKRIK